MMEKEEKKDESSGETSPPGSGEICIKADKEEGRPHPRWLEGGARKSGKTNWKWRRVGMILGSITLLVFIGLLFTFGFGLHYYQQLMNQELWRSISESERIPAYHSDFYFYPHAGHREYMLYSAEIRLRLTSAANVCSHRGMTMFKDLGNETNTNHGFDDSSRRETLEEILELAEDLGLQEIWTSLEIRTGVDPGYFGGLAGLRLGSSGVVRDLFSNSVFTNGETLPGFHVLIFSYRPMIENSCEEEDSDPESEEDAIGHDRVLYDHQQLQPDGSTAWEGNFDFVAKQPYDIGETADVQHPNDTTTNVRMTQDSEIIEYDTEIDSALTEDFIEEEEEDGEGILCDWVVRAVPVTPDLRLNLLCQRELP